MKNLNKSLIILLFCGAFIGLNCGNTEAADLTTNSIENQEMSRHYEPPPPPPRYDRRRHHRPPRYDAPYGPPPPPNFYDRSRPGHRPPPPHRW